MKQEIIDQWLGKLFQQDRRAIAKLISWVEDNVDRSKIMPSILSHTRSGEHFVTGITGSPGAGKSSLVEALTHLYRRQEERVGIIAVDPSSPLTGGAILGDRIRMQAHGTDRNVFIRSMGTRGHLGGAADSTADVLRILEAGGYTTLLVETVGVGQSEIEIMQLADTVVLVLNPGTGDGIQAIKAGIMEIADIFVINKADMPGAERLKNDILMMIEMSGAPQAWRPPVIMTSVLDNQGLDDLKIKISEHQSFLLESGQLIHRRQEQLQREIWRHLEEKAKDIFLTLWSKIPQSWLESGQQDPYQLAEKVWAKMIEG
ncbi:methylmalonyl Co-A mutase-associated GTPase MeaB [Paradesulfitobacterium aromaticivorans]